MISCYDVHCTSIGIAADREASEKVQVLQNVEATFLLPTKCGSNSSNFPSADAHLHSWYRAGSAEGKSKFETLSDYFGSYFTTRHLHNIFLTTCISTRKNWVKVKEEKKPRLYQIISDHIWPKGICTISSWHSAMHWQEVKKQISFVNLKKRVISSKEILKEWSPSKK